MGYWTTTIEEITDTNHPEHGAFYLLSTEFDVASATPCWPISYADYEPSDYDEPAASAGVLFFSEHEARMFAGEHGIALRCDRDFEDSCQREVTLRRDGRTEAQMLRHVRALGRTRLRSEARTNAFAYDEMVRRHRLVA